MHAEVLRRDFEQLLRDAGREPLPSLPSMPAGPTPPLDSLARTVANETGLYSATERVMQTAQAAVASGNFTQVRCAFLGQCISLPLFAGSPLVHLQCSQQRLQLHCKYESMVSESRQSAGL